MADDRYHRLAQIAAKQHGVFSVHDADSAGIPDTTLRRAVRMGRFTDLAPGVFAVAGSPDTAMRRRAVAVCSMPSLAAVSHDTAAEMWGLVHRDVDAIHVVTRRWDRVRRPGVVVHESLDLVDKDIDECDGLPTTTPQRTVVDLGATSKWMVERAFEEGIRRGLFAASDVEAVVTRVARRGRRGVGAIRPVLEARRAVDMVTESVLEDRFLAVVRELALPMPHAQHVVRDDVGAFICRADFAYLKEMLLIELDSEAYHMDRIAFRGDRAKQNAAVSLGWVVLRFTWWDLHDRPHQVGAQIRGLLEARRRS